MRILLIHKFHHRLGGAERIYFDTADILRAAGHEVAFFSMEHPDNEATPWSRFFVSEVYYDDATAGIREKICLAARILWNREANRKLDALIREFRPDVAHCFNIYHQLSPSILWVLKKRKIPIILTLCDFKVVSPNYFLYDFERRRIWDSASGWRCIFDKAVKNSFLKSAVCAVELWLHRMLGSYDLVDTFLSPSAFLIERYHALGFTREVSLVHHPVIGVKDGITFSESLGQLIRGRTDQYVYFGRLSREKGVDVAIRAMALLPGKRLRIVGRGPAENEYRKLADELGLTDQVDFMGPMYGAPLWNLLRSCRAILFPVVWYENQPFAMMEALASGTPLIASRIGSIPAVVQDGKNGILFTPGDAAALAESIRNLSRHNLSDMVRHARETVKVYAPPPYLAEITTVYRQSFLKCLSGNQAVTSEEGTPLIR